MNHRKQPDSLLPLWIMAAAIVWFACCVNAATVNTSAANAQSAFNASASGDVLIVADGTTAGGLNMTGKTGVTIQAANVGKWIIDGGQVRAGSNTLKGAVIQNARTPWWDGALLPGSNCLIEDVLVRNNETIGVCLRNTSNTTLRRVRITRNGTLGMNSGTAVAGGWCENITLEDVEVDNNNYGVPNMPGGQADKVYRASNGLWYRESFDEGGGVKLTRTRGVNKVIRGKFHHNGGPGLWFDVAGNDWTVTGAESFENRNTPDRQSYEGTQFAAEISERITFENCYGHDGSGSSFAAWESPNVKFINCVASGKGLEFRDIDTRGAHWRIRDILVDGMRLYNGARIQQLDPARYPTVIIRNTQTLTGPVQWSAGSGTPPPPPPVLTESPDGTSVTAPGSAIVDRNGDSWALTADRKIARNGSVQAITAGVHELRYVGGIVFQRATAMNLWWWWNGGAWIMSPNGPGEPAPPPAGELEKLKADLAAANAKAAALQAEVDRLAGKINAAKSALE